MLSTQCVLATLLYSILLITDTLVMLIDITYHQYLLLLHDLDIQLGAWFEAIVNIFLYLLLLLLPGVNTFLMLPSKPPIDKGECGTS